MGTRKKKRPEFELPGVLIETIQGYLGPKAVNDLTSQQAGELMAVANYCAQKVGEILEAGPALVRPHTPDTPQH